MKMTVEALRASYLDERLPVSVIAGMLGVKPNTVYIKIAEHNLHREYTSAAEPFGVPPTIVSAAGFAHLGEYTVTVRYKENPVSFKLCAENPKAIVRKIMDAWGGDISIIKIDSSKSFEHENFKGAIYG
jgi:hypothetical protein